MKNCIVFILFLFSFDIQAQTLAKIKFIVKDSQQNLVDDASILVNSKMGKITNKNGIAKFSITKGAYKIIITHLAYKKFEKEFMFSRDSTYNIILQENTEFLQEVVITAKEKEGITATSVINKQAMSHLQPTSFSDLVSLLPGKSATSPLLNYANNLKLREVGISDENYATSSLGVSFVVDDMPINTNANLQTTVGSDLNITPQSYSTNAKRVTIRQGIDMRTIATDGIEKVEIIRGIPSAKYGDLTSGLVKIQRKKGQTKWNSRIKSDGFSKLLYVGKGFYFNKPNINLNVGLDYLDAQPDPRNTFESYKRYTASVRASKIFEGENPITWNLDVDYTGTIDEEKYDEERGYDKNDFYKSTYSNIRISNKLNINFSEGILKNIEFKASVNKSYDKIKQRKFVQITDATSTPINTEEGEFYGVYLEPTYISNLLIDGKPLDIYSDISANFGFSTIKIKHDFLAGFNYSYAKNNGEGQVFNPETPPTAGMNIRARAFKDIPSMQSLAFYLEDVMRWKLQKTTFALQAGVRGNSLVGMDKKYEINEKIYLDPRLNFKVDFPKINFKNGKSLAVNISAGYGKHHKLPTLAILYPQNIYRDFEQLNYYHPTKAYRQVHYKTYVFPQVNYAIKPALNIKKEIRLGLQYNHHTLYATFFNEKMTSGFRNMTDYHSVSYKKYDTSGIDYTTITAAPLVENLPYTTQNALILTGFETNGSAIDKKGIEFQYTGKRFEQINTRFTFNGAWLQTQYYNSVPVYRFMQNQIVNGRTRYEVGLYESMDDYFRENFKSTLTADTYLPKLGLTTSLRFDMNWYSVSKSEPISTIPTHYIDESGEKHLYTETEMNDAILQGLVRVYKEGSNYVTRVPFSMHGHLKISKKFYNYFTLSMYVNDLFAYYADYEVNGVKINRKGTETPYFGMELNMNF